MGVRDFGDTKAIFYRILLVDAKVGGFMYFGTVFTRLKCPADYKPPVVTKAPRGVPLPTITDRQSSIINGSASNVRKNEVTLLLDKLNRLELENEAEEPRRYSAAEASGLLQSFTPWNMPVQKKETKSMDNNRFCDRLKAAINARGMTQTSLAKAAGISGVTYQESTDCSVLTA